MNSEGFLLHVQHMSKVVTMRKSVLRMYIGNIRFGVLMVVNFNLMVVCDTYHENGSSRFLQNIDIFLPYYMGSHPSKK